MTMRIEKDSMGEIDVPLDCLWGAQTARSLKHFTIGWEKMPLEVIRAFGILKKGCAQVNGELGLVEQEKVKWIIQAADEVIAGQLDDHFPLFVWQTGSGTQTNMNANEVIANRAIQLSGGTVGDKSIHPNDDVNRAQSSNDTFPTAMHIAAVLSMGQLIPIVETMHRELEKKAAEYQAIVKIGRTHLMDATPLTLGQEFSGYSTQLGQALKGIWCALPLLHELAIGGTAVGTGLNAPKGYGEKVSQAIATLTGHPFSSAPNKFAALAGHEPLVTAHSALKCLACALLKIANDIRWLGSGPRCGLFELTLPKNEPGSSIMPGKVNPTQCEALTMVATQVMGNDTAITVAASQGNFELNVYKPLIIYNFLQSARLLADAIAHFTSDCLQGLHPNTAIIDKHLNNSLMLVTALTPKIGYDKAAEVATYAFTHNLTLKQACQKLNLLSSKDFDALIRPADMT